MYCTKHSTLIYIHTYIHRKAQSRSRSRSRFADWRQDEWSVQILSFNFFFFQFFSFMNTLLLGVPTWFDCQVWSSCWGWRSSMKDILMGVWCCCSLVLSWKKYTMVGFGGCHTSSYVLSLRSAPCCVIFSTKISMYVCMSKRKKKRYMKWAKIDIETSRISQRDEKEGLGSALKYDRKHSFRIGKGQGVDEMGTWDGIKWKKEASEVQTMMSEQEEKGVKNTQLRLGICAIVIMPWWGWGDGRRACFCVSALCDWLHPPSLALHSYQQKAIKQERKMLVWVAWNATKVGELTVSEIYLVQPLGSAGYRWTGSSNGLVRD